jgi:CRISPR-associated protein (TIGR03986 family)
LIRDCQDLHRDEIKKRADDGVKPSAYVKAEGQNEDQPAFSRHTYENGAEELLDGTLAYVRLEIGPNLNAARLPTISDLFPVMIGRELGNWSSYELLAEGLRPAMSIDDLSPADRVFGWVRDETANTSGREGAPSDLKPPSAWKGQLRIAPIRCDTASAIQAVGDPENGLPLAILSTPKPAQARFYAAQDDTGKPFEDGADIRQKGYFERGSQKPKAGLRGRKVYPHHRAACAASVFASYWDATSAARDARTGRKLDPVPGSSGLYREYVRRATAQGAPQRDGQNRSVRDWVRPGTRFETHIDVMNLNAAELGALLWLLDLGRTQGGEPAAHLRLGGGKPLGFGSVRVTITAIDLADGEARRAEYRSLLGIPDAERAAQAQSGLRLLAKGDAVTEALAHLPTGTEHGARPAGSDPIHPVAAFKTAIAQACGKPGAFDEMPAIAAYLIAARGFADALPLHYARTGECADPEGKNYEWFVANQHPQRGRKLALPDIRTDTGLPRDLQR